MVNRTRHLGYPTDSRTGVLQALLLKALGILLRLNNLGIPEFASTEKLFFDRSVNLFKGTNDSTGVDRPIWCVDPFLALLQMIRIDGVRMIRFVCV